MAEGRGEGCEEGDEGCGVECDVYNSVNNKNKEKEFN